MKKTRNNLIELAILTALIASVVVTLTFQSGRVQRVSRPTQLSVILREPDSPLWFNTRQGMEQAAADLVADLRFLPPSSYNDGWAQADLIRRDSDGGADAFIITAAAPLALGPQLTDLTQKPVVALESPLEGALAQITVDDEALGSALAQALLEDWTGGTVLLIDVSQRGTAAARRLESARQVLETAGIPLEYRAMPVSQLTEKLPRLTSQTAAHYVLTFDGAATAQAAQAKEDSALTCALYGVGSGSTTAALLEQGTLSAAAVWSDYAAGYLAVSQAVSIYHSPIDVPQQTVPFSVIREEDIYEPEVEALLFPVIS